ncbi:hypothetical protein [Photobacterium nomapromontoriensis]|uniref:hypothetical protein n=1 Tax=Photobacterium nomapromontoriensis TaxID=2910237 RepID=UPI003D0E8171
MRVFLDPTDVGRSTLYPTESWGSYVEAINDEWIGRTVAPTAYREQRKQYKKSLGQLRKSAKKFQQEFGIDSQYAEALAADKAKNNLSTLSLPALPTTNEALKGLANALPTEAKGYSEKELEQLAQQREAMARREASLAEQKNVLFRNLHEKASYIAGQSLQRELTQKEKEFIEDYKSKNQIGKRIIEEIMARSRQA